MTPTPDAPKKTKVVGKDGLTKHQRYYKRWCRVTLQLDIPIKGILNRHPEVKEKNRERGHKWRKELSGYILILPYDNLNIHTDIAILLENN
jgi:hypothetical protein